jgi:hypothetical protein
MGALQFLTRIMIYVHRSMSFQDAAKEGLEFGDEGES